jgi:hypothetical protein
MSFTGINYADRWAAIMAANEAMMAGLSNIRHCAELRFNGLEHVGHHLAHGLRCRCQRPSLD